MLKEKYNKIAVAIGAALVALFLFSCRGPKEISKTEIHTAQKETIKDSTAVRDTTYKVTADSASVTLFLPRTDSTVIDVPAVSNKLGRARITVGVKNGKIEARADCDSLDIVQRMYYQLRERYIELERDTTRSSEITHYIARPKNNWDWFLRIFFAVTVTFLAVKAYNKIKKPF